MDECMTPNAGTSGWKRNVLLLIVMHVVLGLLYLSDVPRVFVDEVWDSALGWNLARTGSLRHPFIEGFGGVDVHFVQPRVVLPFFCAAIFKFSDYGIVASRIGSVIFGALAVVCLYAVMRRWFGERQAFWIGLAVVVHPWFFEISRRARPEIYCMALALAFLWLVDIFFDSGSRRTAFFAGVLAGLSALAHPNGIILVFSISCAVLLWRRGKSLGRLVGYAGVGAVLAVLPYVIYVLWAIRDPRVSLAKQMQIGMLHGSVLAGEIVRWKSFLQWPKGLGLAGVVLASWIGAWYRSSRSDKALATMTALFAVLLPFAAVNRTPRYLGVTTAFLGAMVVRLAWRIMADRAAGWQSWGKSRFALCASIVAVYSMTCIGGIGLMFYSLRAANFAKVVDRVASVVGSESRVFGDPIFWLGHDRYRYGPYLITYEKIPLREIIRHVREHDFDYAIRTAWLISPPKGIGPPPRLMPEFRRESLCDHLCRLFGTKTDEFYDPYYGPIEIYKLNWVRPAQDWR
jgi:4-amino-4-deoxy-L-arabinose transferase-like glycosyltransferase